MGGDQAQSAPATAAQWAISRPARKQSIVPIPACDVVIVVMECDAVILRVAKLLHNLFQFQIQIQFQFQFCTVLTRIYLRVVCPYNYCECVHLHTTVHVVHIITKCKKRQSAES